MELLRLEHVSKSYGNKILFEDLNLTISAGQKIALVARNGSGKTSLLQLIAGEISPEGENSKIFLSKGIRRSYLKQQTDFHPNATIIDIIFDTDNPRLLALKAYNDAMASGDELKIKETMGQLEALQAWEMEATYKEILSKFHFTDFEKQASMLSGGEKKRLAIAKILIDQPEFMILDEPTNHLDIEMIEWLEQYLKNPKLTLFMVTHDRYFLERICDEIVELERGVIHNYSGNYSDFLLKKAARQQNDAIRKEKMGKLFKKELDWMRRMPQARTTKAKSRIDKFYEIEDAAKVNLDESNIEIPVQTKRMGSKIIEAHAITKAYDGREIIKTFSYKFKKKEKVGIVGPNGAGKTTFLKLLTKEIRPDGGKVVIGDTIDFGHYTQEGLKLKRDMTVIEAIREVAEFLPLEKGKKLTAESLLERFLFPREHQRVYVSQLSGGEKRRLHLLTILMKNPNFLILDEPTNDLDILTLNVLENYLEHFPGVVLIVSHDRYFLDKLVDHLFILDRSGNIKDYNGKYSEYRQYLKNKESASSSSSVEKIESPDKLQKNLDFEEKKKIKNRIRKLEKMMEDLNKEKSKIHTGFENMTIPQDEIPNASKRLSDISDEIESSEMEWLELSEKLEE